MALASLCGVVDVGMVMVAVVVVMMADAGCPVVVHGGRYGFRCHGLGCGCDGDGAWCGCHVLCNC